MNKKIFFTAEEALENIWEIRSDSELNDLDNSDNDDEIVPNPRIGDVDESGDDIELQTEEAGKVETPAIEEVENPEIEASEGNVEQEEEENAQTLTAKFEKQQPR